MSRKSKNPAKKKALSKELKLHIENAFTAAASRTEGFEKTQYFQDLKGIIGEMQLSSRGEFEALLVKYFNDTLTANLKVTPRTGVLTITGHAPTIKQTVAGTMTSTANVQSWINGTVVPPKVKHGIDLVLLFTILSLVAQILTNTAWWDSHVRGMTAEAKAEEAAALAHAVVSQAMQESGQVRRISKLTELRESPSARAHISRMVPPRTQVRIRQIKGAFAQIEFDGPLGELYAGWVFLRYLQK